jgi:hypothetical protein
MNKEELDPESLPPIDVEAELEKLPDEFGEMNGMIIFSHVLLAVLIIVTNNDNPNLTTNDNPNVNPHNNNND